MFKEIFFLQFSCSCYFYCELRQLLEKALLFYLRKKRKKKKTRNVNEYVFRSENERVKIQWSLICLWNFCVLARQAHVQLEKQNDVLHFHFVGIINIFASRSSSSLAGKPPRVRMRRWMDSTVRVCLCI